jgi:hypothetical protein
LSLYICLINTERDALLQLNVQFQLGVLLYDNLCDGDQETQEVSQF